MTVYIDNAKNKLGRMIMSHMVADTMDELHLMADRVGLKRQWYQITNIPHYDLCQSKRELAISLGAIPITTRELVELSRCNKDM